MYKKAQSGWNLKYTERLKQKRNEIYAGGGDKKIEKQHNANKLTARERIEYLFDKGTFSEVDAYIETQAVDFDMSRKKKLGDGVVIGYGLVNGRQVFVAAQDFTVIGGTFGQAHTDKICHIQEMAYQMRSPIVFLNDSGGGRIEEGVCALSTLGEVFANNVKSSGVIPQIAAVLGPCAGGASYSPALCDYILMTQDTSKMFITGPGVVREVIGEKVTAEELGGAQIHGSKTGVVHFIYENDYKTLDGVKTLLSYLPQNTDERPPRKQTNIVDLSERIEYLVPDNGRKVYDVKAIIQTFVDDGSMLEVQKDYAQNIVVGLARLDGEVIGIVANQPLHMGGSLDCMSAEKAARFIRTCDCFNIPIISLVDVPGFFPGREQEQSGIIRRGAKLLYAYAEAKVPKITLIMRKAYGGAYIAMNSKGIGADRIFAWPIAELAVMGAEGAVDILFRHDIEGSSDPEKFRKDRIEEYSTKFMNPYSAASKGYVDEVIFPEETRNKLCATLHMLKTKQQEKVLKKHGNIPL